MTGHQDRVNNYALNYGAVQYTVYYAALQNVPHLDPIFHVQSLLQPKIPRVSTEISLDNTVFRIAYDRNEDIGRSFTAIYEKPEKAKGSVAWTADGGGAMLRKA